MTKPSIEEFLPDNVGETKVTIDGNYIFFTSIQQDDFAENPHDNWDGFGKIISLGNRHVNFDRDAVEDAVENDPDVVLLSYFEHSNCIWSVSGELPPGANCPWDSVEFAGVWVP